MNPNWMGQPRDSGGRWVAAQTATAVIGGFVIFVVAAYLLSGILMLLLFKGGFKLLGLLAFGMAAKSRR